MEKPNEGPDIRCQAAVTLIEQHLSGGLQHPEYIIKLVQFSHDSPGLRTYKRHVAEALVLLLESNGFHVFNGLTEAAAAVATATEESNDHPTVGDDSTGEAADD